MISSKIVYVILYFALPGECPKCRNVIGIVIIYTVSQKKLPTFKLSVALSYLNRFSKFLHRWKAYEICYKTHMTLLTSPYVCCYSTLGK